MAACKKPHQIFNSLGGIGIGDPIYFKTFGFASVADLLKTGNLRYPQALF